MKKKKETSGNIVPALVAGLAGACALTLVHETVRRFNADAPRMDILGERALAKTMIAADVEPPAEEKLYLPTLVGDIVSNALYYSLAGGGKNAIMKGSLLGLAAGIGGIMLPGPLGLGKEPSGRTPQTKAMTIAWYFLGGLTTALVSKALSKKNK